MEFYAKYKDARDKAWAFLIQNNIVQFPFDIKAVIKNLGIALSSYQQSKDFFSLLGVKPADAAAGYDIDGKVYIFYQDMTDQRVLRFSLAHELGHVVTGNLMIPGETENPDKEKEANVFARCVLMPMIVIKHHDLSTAEAISDFFGTSLPAAEIRLERYLMLKARRGGKDFLQSPLERQYYEMYKEAIKQ